eukprot:364217-Hanusia_phi.AAC.7
MFPILCGDQDIEVFVAFSRHSELMDELSGRMSNPGNKTDLLGEDVKGLEELALVHLPRVAVGIGPLVGPLEDARGL